MFRRIDESPFLSNLLQRVSGSLARQRGLPVVLGLLLVIISFIISLANVYADSQALDLLWSITHHLGIIIALIGLLLVEPLGR